MGKELALPAALALLAAEDADAWPLHSLTLSHSVFDKAPPNTVSMVKSGFVGLWPSQTP